MGKKQATELIKRLGGKYQSRYSWPFSAITEVDLMVSDTTDEDLAQLASLKRLRKLDLRMTRVTDAGLCHLRGFRFLEELVLDKTAVTDQGLECLKALSGLRNLNLVNTGVTDRALELLREFRGLQQLVIGGDGITREGVQAFEKAMPGVWVLYLGEEEGDPGSGPDSGEETLPWKKKPAGQDALSKQDELAAQRLNRLFAAARSLRGRNRAGYESALEQIRAIQEELSADPPRMSRIEERAGALSGGTFHWEP